MYVPIMKARQEELKVSKKLSYCFSDKIVPLFEILKEEYEDKYELDENGKIKMILKPGQKRRQRVKKAHTENDIVTLENLNNRIKKSKAFIDYFRFNAKKYGGSKVDINGVDLAYRLSRNEDEYIEKLLGVSSYKNLIPVLSLKDKFTFSKNRLIEIINLLKSKNESIALRLEDSIFESVKEVLEENLRECDFLLYDINEQNIESKVMELFELNECEIKAKKIIIHSPRKLKNNNKQYENNSVTALIDNSIADSYEDYDFDGFGDYGGLKDQLPTSDTSNGKGAALGLVYSRNENSFYSFCNSDTSLGMKGYVQVIEDILEVENELNPENNCPFYEEINKMYENDKTGNWATWNNLTLTRYIHQMYIYQ
ncbi:hypothetical protein GNF78_05970 [Clostridium perfringens]|uniref:beta family protein n=1 Tax=Clostridium perfringens TaxID=1502 RepID=UPI000DF0F24E|nr:hypothetical protein [Clostridium perfringens]EGT4143778.1 hypothetical protein [Clostridium perfringens]MDM0624940.1 hypothetical protein [Clostridium perfringens]MDZ5036804.1 hypothetical protein [Clostridium perfringens]STB41890.1 Uncharacterised protein [Clostridium perfringens]